ncbi:MAG: hypothetical protein NC310_00085 [Roseburia sp.]|nr:hypothetical protein [Anaeroplasma bactoclasticum]MCM1195452.1 hypothetical protein [Roseburia sp.]MCM1555931.1 hypothetical protein [Anaeroplasma bactoclasticum]
MGKRSIKKNLIQEANQIEIPDVKSSILSKLPQEEYYAVERKTSFSLSKFRFAIPAFLFLIFVTCFSILISNVIPKGQYDEYKEVKDLDKVQSVYAYQVTLLSTLVNNTNAIDASDTAMEDALSNSIGFVDLVLNLNQVNTKLYYSSMKEYKYYLSTNLNDEEFCKFYFNEQSIKSSSALKTVVLNGIIEYKDSTFLINGESVQNDEGFYKTNFMLGYENAKVCLSSDENAHDSYEYRVYNNDVICKTVSLEFKDNEIYMNVDFQNEYFKFQIQGNNNQYRGNYHTGNQSGSLMVEIENDKYNFNVDESHSSAERYVFP